MPNRGRRDDVDPHDERKPLPPQAKGWGNVARRGAREVSRRQDDGSQPTAAFGRDDNFGRTTPAPRPQSQWERSDGARNEWQDDERPVSRSRAAKAAAGANAAPTPIVSRNLLPADVATDIRRSADMATQHHKNVLVEKAESAYGAYLRGRYSDALRAIKPVAEEVPMVAAVREVAGLAAYRAGKFRDALKHLQAYADLSDDIEHFPVMMDCQRALRKPKKVVEIWTELRQRSPEPDVLAEGRLVAAASLADSGQLQDAIAMLANAGAAKALRNPSDRHVRQWYLLADLYERAGDVPRAREYFERVAKVDPEAYDVPQRLIGLGGRAAKPRRRPPVKAVPQPSPASPTARKRA